MMADDLRQMLGELRNVAIEKLQSAVKPRALIIERHSYLLMVRRKTVFEYGRPASPCSAKLMTTLSILSLRYKQNK